MVASVKGERRLHPKKLLRLLAIHSLALALLLFAGYVYRCPVRLLFDYPCPACGLSRAYIAVLRLDFATAFTCHPLFFTLPPTLLYAAHRNKLKRRVQPKTEVTVLLLLLLAFAAVYVYRILSNTLIF